MSLTKFHLLLLSICPFLKKSYGCASNYFVLGVSSSTCFVLCPYVEHSKLSPRSSICVFLGYRHGQKIYQCYDPINEKLYDSCHVVFLEHIHFYSIPFNSHYLTKSYINCIDPLATVVASSPLQVNHNPTNYDVELSKFDTYSSSNSYASSISMAPQEPNYNCRSFSPLSSWL